MKHQRARRLAGPVVVPNRPRRVLRSTRRQPGTLTGTIEPEDVKLVAAQGFDPAGEFAELVRAIDEIRGQLPGSEDDDD